MTRRDLMALAGHAATLAGGQLFFPEWLQAAQAAHQAHGSTAPPEPDRWSHYKPQFFSPAEFAMVEAFSQILIPTDETPGAKEAHVAPFTDFLVNAAFQYAPEMQKEWREAMAWLAGQKFGELDTAQRESLVAQMAAPERDPSAQHAGFGTYKLIKQMTVFAYYTSRAGLVENLEYKGNAYLTEFPACTHPEHQRV